MRNSELKACPFCGKPARLFYIGEDDRISKTLRNMWIVGCETDLCPGYIWKAAPVYVTEPMARDHWDRRSVG